MSSFRPGFAGTSRATVVPYPRTPAASQDLPDRRGVSVMRKYEVAAMHEDGSVVRGSHVAPATALYESATAAFARGTLIPTPDGPVAIEDLQPGDRIETTTGIEPVVWIGSTPYLPGLTDDATTLTALTRITADGFGPGRPEMDLLAGPGARLVVRHQRLLKLLGQEAVLAPVADYADGDRFVTVAPGGAVQLFHLMVRNHTTLKIGGVEMETYHPGKSAAQLAGQNQRSLFLSLFPHLPALESFGQVSMTRTTRDVIENLIDS